MALYVCEMLVKNYVDKAKTQDIHSGIFHPSLTQPVLYMFCCCLQDCQKTLLLNQV